MQWRATLPLFSKGKVVLGPFAWAPLIFHIKNWARDNQRGAGSVPLKSKNYSFVKFWAGQTLKVILHATFFPYKLPCCVRNATSWFDPTNNVWGGNVIFHTPTISGKIATRYIAGGIFKYLRRGLSIWADNIWIEKVWCNNINRVWWKIRYDPTFSAQKKAKYG